jgi:hypothetical protein
VPVDRIAIQRPAALTTSPLVAVRRAPEDAGGSGAAGAAGDAAGAAIAALRKSVDAAEAALRGLERDGADERAIQGARQQVTVASAALANALSDQAERAQKAAAATKAASGGVDTYA